jgi:hypothetical protein
MVMRTAATVLGAGAEVLFSSIRTPDLALVAYVETARTLLGQPIDIHNIELRW